MRRVLRPGGTFAATLPASGPLPVRDGLRWAPVLLALGVTGLSYPNDDALAAPRPVLAEHGLTLLSDEAQGFVLDLASQDVADRLVEALYLPEVRPSRVRAARQVVRRWVGRQITVPVRRLVARA